MTIAGPLSIEGLFSKKGKKNPNIPIPLSFFIIPVPLFEGMMYYYCSYSVISLPGVNLFCIATLFIIAFE